MSKPQLNPFYIENHEDDDFDWRNDEEDLEVEGLLEQTNHATNPVQEGARRRRQEDRFSSRHHKRPKQIRLRYLICFVVVFILFLFLLSSTSSSSSSVTPGGSSATTQHQHVNIVVLGERNSGVRWLEHHLSTCYPNVTVTRELTRDAYWFQDGPDHVASSSRWQHGGQRIILVAIFRDPYDWIYQMNQQPIYMPAHMNQSEPMGWETFVSTPWTNVNSPTESENTTENDQRSDGTCQLGFSPSQVIPCRIDDDPENQRTHPIYELNQQNGEPFVNIADLRAAKIRNIMVEVPDLWKSYLSVSQPIVLHYESTLFASLERINEVTGWRYECSQDAATPNDPSMHDPEYRNWVKKHVHWKEEALINYKKKSSRGRSLLERRKTIV